MKTSWIKKVFILMLFIMLIPFGSLKADHHILRGNNNDNANESIPNECTDDCGGGNGGGPPGFQMEALGSVMSDVKTLAYFKRTKNPGDLIHLFIACNDPQYIQECAFLVGVFGSMPPPLINPGSPGPDPEPQVYPAGRYDRCSLCVSLWVFLCVSLSQCVCLSQSVCFSHCECVWVLECVCISHSVFLLLSVGVSLSVCVSLRVCGSLDFVFTLSQCVSLSV